MNNHHEAHIPLAVSEVNKMQEKGFDFDDSVHRDEAFARMNTMRKESHFCDAVLEVMGKPIFVHRVVLASSNVFFFELFSRSDERSSRRDEKPIYAFDDYDLDFIGVDLIVGYFYTARIHCSFNMVWSLYKAAIKLKVPRVVEQCSEYLIQCLTPQNCLGTCKFVTMLEGKDCIMEVAAYIQENFQEVLEMSSELAHLPCVRVDIVGSVSPDFYLTEQPLCKLVVSWLHEEAVNSSLERLSEDPHVLLLSPDNKLIDCCEELSDTSLNNADIIKDYKKHCDKKQSCNKGNDKRIKQSGSPGNKSPLPHLSDNEEESRCNMVASSVVADKSFMCIAVLGKNLINVSIKFRPDDSIRKTNVHESNLQELDIVFTSDRKQSQCLMTQLFPMSTARCGFGTAVIDKDIVVIGGYGRGECLNSAESYSLLTNKWKSLKPMHRVRGRLSAGVVGGKLLACGGSDGSVELNSVEAYDPSSDTWTNIPDMIYRKSSAGVAVCSGKLYVIGGLSGSKTLSSCEMYDPLQNKWKKISDLNTGRSQAGVCSYASNSAVVALGGCNAWNCMNSCEIYDPAIDEWTELPPLAIARRGAGAAHVNDMLYVVGGSDAQASLTSVEIYDPESGSWFFGPCLAVPRANMGVTVLDNRIFVLGGYSGKSFLKSLEYLSHDAEEWCSFLPPDVDVATILRASSPQSKRRTKNGHRGNGSSRTGSIGSNAAIELMNEVQKRMSTNGMDEVMLMHSDSESSSACSLDDLQKESMVSAPGSTGMFLTE